MNFHVARDGVVIGEFNEQVFRDKVFRGEVRRDDFYWTEGMTEWQSVAQLSRGRANAGDSARAAARETLKLKAENLCFVDGCFRQT